MGEPSLAVALGCELMTVSRDPHSR